MRIRQIVFAVRDLAAGSARLAALLGLDPPFRDPGVAEFGLDNAVFVFGDQFIELVAPVREGTTAGRLLDRRGNSGYMLILQTDDFERERARLAALGVRTVFEAELPEIRAVHLHPKDLGGAIVSVDQSQPAASWRWGGPDWRLQPGRRREQRVVGVTVEAGDPRAMAARWAQVLGLAAPVAEGAGYRLGLEGGQVDFVAAGARGEGISGFTLAVADLPALRQSASALGLSLQGDSLALFGTRIELRGNVTAS
ncbi:MAG: VOC family protein [Caldimonas sp.]